MKISFTALIALGAILTFLLSTKATPLPSGCANILDSGIQCQNSVDGAQQDKDKRITYLQPIPARDYLEYVKALHPRVAPLRGGGGSSRKPDEEGVSGGSRSGVGSGTGTSGEVSTVGGPTLGRRPPPAGEGSTGAAVGDTPPVVASTFGDATREGARAVGQGKQQGLDDAITQNLPDNDKGAIETLGYKRVDSEVTDDIPIRNIQGGDGSEYLLPSISGATKSGWTNQRIMNSETDDLAEGSILDYSVNDVQGVLIVKKAFANAEDNKRDPKTGLPINGDASSIMKLKDMMMDSWRQVATASEVSTVKDLNFIVRDDVVTTDSKEAIDAAFAMTGADRRVATEFRSTTTDPKELAAYQEIAGTVHGGGIIQMLADHHVELGDLKVVSWRVFTNQSAAPSYYSIIAVLGRG